MLCTAGLVTLLFIVTGLGAPAPPDSGDHVVRDVHLQVRYPRIVREVSNYVSQDQTLLYGACNGTPGRCSIEAGWEKMDALINNQRIGSETTDGKRLPHEGTVCHLRSDKRRLTDGARPIVLSRVLLANRARMNLPDQARIDRFVVHLEVEIHKAQVGTVPADGRQRQQRQIDWDTNEQVNAKPRPLRWADVPDGVRAKVTLFRDSTAWSVPYTMNHTYTGQTLRFPIETHRQRMESVTDDGTSLIFGYSIGANAAWDFPLTPLILNRAEFGAAVRFECDRDRFAPESMGNTGGSGGIGAAKKGRAFYCNFDVRVRYVTFMIEYTMWGLEHVTHSDKWDQTAAVNCPVRTNGCDCFGSQGVPENQEQEQESETMAAGNATVADSLESSVHFRTQHCFPPFWLSPPGGAVRDVILNTEAFYLVAPLTLLYIRATSALVVDRPLTYGVRVSPEDLIPGESPCEAGAIALLRDGDHIRLSQVAHGMSEEDIDRENLREALAESELSVGGQRCSLVFHTQPTVEDPGITGGVDVLLLNAEKLDLYFDSFSVETPRLEVEQILVYTGASCLQVDDEIYTEWTDLTDRIPVRLDFAMGEEARVVARSTGDHTRTMQRRFDQQLSLVDYEDYEDSEEEEEANDDDDDDDASYVVQDAVVQDASGERHYVVEELQVEDPYAQTARCLRVDDQVLIFLPGKGLVFRATVGMHPECKTRLQRALDRMGSARFTSISPGILIVVGILLSICVVRVFYKMFHRVMDRARRARDRFATTEQGYKRSQRVAKKATGEKSKEKPKKKDKEKKERVVNTKTHMSSE